MKPYHDQLGITIYHGDCMDTMAGMEPGSVDSIVTDPPYGLEFMGKEWDKLGATVEYPADGEGPWGRQNRVRYGDSARSMQAWHESWARAAFRVLKPGGHLLAFSGTRTSHRMVCAIEDAGFEIRDSIVWMYGSGFPKSLDVGKAIDKAAGVSREVIGSYRVSGNALTPTKDKGGTYGVGVPNTPPGDLSITAPATDLARQWDGWHTALKPSHEPICVARKPLVGTVAQNVIQHGTGAINVDSCRIGTDTVKLNSYSPNGISGSMTHPGATSHAGRDYVSRDSQGRWPANLILGHHPDCIEVGVKRVKGSGWSQTGSKASDNRAMSGANYQRDPKPDLFADSDGRETVAAWDCHEACPIRQLDDAVGERKGKVGMTQHGSGTNSVYGTYGRTEQSFVNDGASDTGGPSRFFLNVAPDPLDGEHFMYCAKASRRERNEGLPEGMTNTHPTVKSVALMRWLVRLVTPPGGLVLDPFMGSGSTGVAASREGFRFIGIEQSEEYVEIAVQRMKVRQHRLIETAAD